jgi:hypothetical protein
LDHVKRQFRGNGKHHQGEKESQLLATQTRTEPAADPRADDPTHQQY